MSEALIFASINPKYDQIVHWITSSCTQHVLDMFWAWSYHVLNLNFNEQSVVILWVIWGKNESFWHIFTCDRIQKNCENVVGNNFLTDINFDLLKNQKRSFRYCRQQQNNLVLPQFWKMGATKLIQCFPPICSCGLVKPSNTVQKFDLWNQTLHNFATYKRINMYLRIFVLFQIIHNEKFWSLWIN